MNNKDIPSVGYTVTTEHADTEVDSLLNKTWGIRTFLSNDQGIHLTGGVNQKLCDTLLLIQTLHC